MATEILINDGGAPARILPFIAGSTIAAGEPLSVKSDGEVSSTETAASGALCLGVSLTATTSGNMCNVISGRGVMLNVSVSGTATTGGELEMSGLGDLITCASTPASGGAVALALADHSGDPTLTRVLLI